MSDYLEKIFQIYLETKEEEKLSIGYIKENIKAYKPPIEGNYKEFLSKISSIYNSKVLHIEEKPNFELGELYMVDNFIFLLTGKQGSFFTGYKVSEWVEFATEKDFIFHFNGDSYLAILEKLYIPKLKIGTFIGKISKKYIDILSDFENRNIPIPDKFTGLTLNEDSPQHKFRKIELEEVGVFLKDNKIRVASRENIAYYPVSEGSENRILNFEQFKKEFSSAIKEIKFPPAAHTAIKTATTSQFKLHYNSSKNILTLILNDRYKTPSVIEIKVFDNIYKFFAESNILQIELSTDYINLSYLANNMEILNE